MNEETLLEKLRDIGAKIIPYGNVLFSKVWGSFSHNTNLPESDADFLAVYVSPTRKVLSLTPPPDTLTEDGGKPDFQAHEVYKFCQLLLKGNPGIVEMLFTDKLCLETEEWLNLKELRNKFLSRQAVNQYLGYCEGQLKKLINDKPLHTAGGGYNTKWAYHMLRLVADAKKIAQGKQPIVWKENDEREFLMKVRRNEFAKEEIIQLATKGIGDVKNLEPWLIPEQGDKEVLENWLLNLRKKYY